MEQFYTQSAEEVLQKFGVNPEMGLSETEIEKRREKYGLNKLASKKQKSLLSVFLEQFKSSMVAILLIAAIVSGVIGVIEGEGLVESFVIIAILLLNAIIGTVEERKAQTSLEALNKMSSPRTKVMREGQIEEIDSTEIVPGDIVVLDTGDIIPADMRLIEAFNLKVQESALTGESVPVDKIESTLEGSDITLGDRTNMAFSTSIVTYGRGRGVIVGTGMNTEVGKIANMLQSTEATETPMSKRLGQLGKVLGYVALIICTVIFVIGIIYGNHWLEMLMMSVSLAVAAIPEGLQIVSTIVLAIGVQRLVKKNAIVRTLPAVETLGSTTVICSDKTGTLTQNRMTVVESWEPGGDGEPSERLVRTAVLCTDASLSANGEDAGVVGDPTEVALVRWGLERGLAKPEVEARYPRVTEVPFDSARKRMTTVHRTPDGALEIATKGGLDEVLAACTQIDAEQRAAIEDANARMAHRALRVLALAGRRLDADDDVPHGQGAEQDLDFLGLVGMIDPPREQVPKTVAECTSAGITTVMITGDHAATAEAIAGEIGLLDPPREVVTGRELAATSDEELAERVTSIGVYARVSPQDKVRIVEAWRAQGAVVAMTGDGVNDAPALQRADIGCAMGLVGTDVAKDASDIVLTDDDFATIVAAVREGRRIESNVLKSIAFLLSTNIGEVLALVVAIALGWFAPLAATHILLINLVTDGAPALALGVDPAEKDIMRRGPSRGAHIFTPGRVRRILYQGAAFGAVTLVAFQLGGAGERASLELAQTMAFATLALSQVVHSFSVRSMTRSVFVDPPWRNRMLLIAATFSTTVVA